MPFRRRETGSLTLYFLAKAEDYREETMQLRLTFLGLVVTIDWTSAVPIALFWLLALAYLYVRKPRLPLRLLVVTSFILLAISILQMVLHEAGHVLMASLVGVKIVGLGFDVVGPATLPELPLLTYTPWKGLVISVAGSLVNLVAASIALLFARRFPQSLARTCLLFTALVNLTAGVLSLLPFREVDGGVAVVALLMLIFGVSPQTAQIGQSVIGFGFGLLLLIAAFKGKLLWLDDFLKGFW